MKKIWAVLCWALILISGCNKDVNTPPLGKDLSVPTLSFPIASFSSAKFFIAFGDSVHSVRDSRSYVIELADTTQSIVSACKGIVSGISNEQDGTLSVLIDYKSNSIYSFTYSGLKNVVVQPNDSLNPGTILGKISRRGELTFTVAKNGNEAICPSIISNAGFNAAIQFAIDRHNMLNPSDSVLAPCIMESLPL